MSTKIFDAWRINSTDIGELVKLGNEIREVQKRAINREQDNYRFVTSVESELLQEVQEMEQNSRWLPGVPSKSIHVVPLVPIEVPIVVQKIADDPMLTRKVTLDAGTTGRFKLPELLPMKGEKI